MGIEIVGLIGLGMAAGGFVAGVLVGRNNPGDVEKIIANVKAEIQRDQRRIDELKAKLTAQGIKL
jgi:Kef-type K+ transport system membrane component KefB